MTKYTATYTCETGGGRLQVEADSKEAATAEAERLIKHLEGEHQLESVEEEQPDEDN